MKVVIDVDENLVCEGFERPFTEEERDILIRAIGNGTPLPKGHGDLIDRDNIETYITKEFKGKLTENEADLFVQFTNVTDEIPAVIEADEENNDGDSD